MRLGGGGDSGERCRRDVVSRAEVGAVGTNADTRNTGPTLRDPDLMEHKKMLRSAIRMAHDRISPQSWQL